MEKSRKPRETMTRLQIIQTHDLLKGAIEPQPDGLFTYKEGFSDQSIAEAMKVNTNHVARLRVELFGRLRSARDSSSERDRAEFDGLKAQVEQMSKHLEELRVKYHKLVLAMSLQGHHELRHLSLVDMELGGKPAPKK